LRLIILFATLAIALPFIISSAALPFGNAVSQRFLERPTNIGLPRYTIPTGTAAGRGLDPDSLAAWIQAQGKDAQGYAWRVIPLDVIFLLVLGLFLGMASTTLAGLTQWPLMFTAIPVLIVWLLPALYIVCDLAEDTLIFTMLNWPSTIQSIAFTTMSLVRPVKIYAVSFGIVQVFLLTVFSYIWPTALRPL
jgi:hypothetical protein